MGNDMIDYVKLDPLSRACYVNARSMLNRRPDKKVIYVTSVMSPVRQYLLRKRHGAELFKKLKVEDLDEFLWMILGSAIHAYLAKFKIRHAWQEVKRLELRVRDWLVVGRPDIYYKRKRKLDDYKWCKVYAPKYNMDEWKWQLNIYRLAFWMEGYSIKDMGIEAIYRNWDKRDMGKQNYPTREREYFKVNFIPLEEVWNRINKNLLILNFAMNMPDDKLPICTPEERWATPDIWALMKNGGKRAIKTFNNKNSAVSYGAKIPNTHLEYRPGYDRRCVEFCNVNEFCNYYQEKYGDKNVDS